MSRLGSAKNPAIVRVQTEERGEKIVALCNQNGWQVIVGVEPDKPEDISDVERLMNPTIVTSGPQVGRNDPCPCGSGLKYKKCCGR